MGKKKKAAESAPLSKKERKALEAREAELAAELKKREKKAAKKAAEKAAAKSSKKKAGKKSKAPKHDADACTTPEPVGAIVAEAEGPITPEPEPETPVDLPSRTARDETIDPATGQTRPEVIAERKAEREKMQAELDEAIKARVQAKRAAREAGEPVDVKAARMPDALPGETEVEYQQRRFREKAEAAAVEKTAEAVEAIGQAIEVVEALGQAIEVVEALGQAIEVVETEHGREFAAGASVAADEFAKPSEAPRELEEGRNGYKIIQLDETGKPDPRKVRQMTRVTTFVSNIDDETTLKKWEKRKVVEGLALDATSPESAGLVPKVNEIAHRRDVAIAKAIKADRKGKLGIGEVATLIADAEKTAKDAIDAIVEEAAELAGRSAKAHAGTHLHALAEISDEKGIDEVRRMHEAGEAVLNVETGENVPITTTDLASIEAYAERMTRLGAKVIESEAVIVNDEMGYAGRLDRVIMARLPELTIGKGTPGEYVRPADQRARRYIADIKSGRVDLGAGKFARQLAAYALGDLYELETGERSRHSAVRDVALVFHLPQGAGVCRVHPVDLKAGTALLKLSAEVRRARNTGKKAIDTSVDVTDLLTGSED